MLALYVATDSNSNLNHFCHCLTIIIGRKVTFCLACNRSKSHLAQNYNHFEKEDLQEEAKKRQKTKKKRKCGVLKGLNYTGLGKFKATDHCLTPLFFFPNRAVFLVCPSRSLLTCQFDKDSIVVTHVRPVC